MFVSIVVATRNRADSLLTLLESIGNLEKVVDWEVVIVDNGSTDSTKEISGYYEKIDKEKYRYVYEKNLGKSFALNSGIREARGNILAFTDDDCILDRSWLVNIRREFESDPELAILGGRVELYNKEDSLVTVITHENRMNFRIPENLFNDPIVIGCNMAAKRTVFDIVGGYDLSMGPGAAGGAVAEDTDWIYRAYRRGFKIMYCPSVLVYHNHGRRTQRQVKNLMDNYFTGRGAFYCRHILRWDPVVFGIAMQDVTGIIRGTLIDLVRGRPGPLYRMRVLKGIIKGACVRLIYHLKNEVAF